MNSAHDMGGMHGLGPIAPEADEPVFHEPWEARMLALTLAVGALGHWNIDAGRHARERIPGADYLAMSYYEKWYEGLVRQMIEHGLVTEAELARGTPDPGPPHASASRVLRAGRVAAMLSRGGPSNRAETAPPRFAPGDKVRARNLHPLTHTRLPRYVRGHVGVILRRHGTHVLPDSNAHFKGEAPEPLYGVRFAARDLWGEAAAAPDAVLLDLWESYLEPA